MNAYQCTKARIHDATTGMPVSLATAASILESQRDAADNNIGISPRPAKARAESGQELGALQGKQLAQEEPQALTLETLRH